MIGTVGGNSPSTDVIRAVRGNSSSTDVIRAIRGNSPSANMIGTVGGNSPSTDVIRAVRSYCSGADVIRAVRSYCSGADVICTVRSNGACANVVRAVRSNRPRTHMIRPIRRQCLRLRSPDIGHCHRCRNCQDDARPKRVLHDFLHAPSAKQQPSVTRHSFIDGRLVGPGSTRLVNGTGAPEGCTGVDGLQEIWTAN